MATFDHTVLRRWREESGRRPEEVCFRAQISASYLRAIEHGDRVNPSAAVLARLAGVYARDVGELFPDDSPRLRVPGERAPTGSAPSGSAAGPPAAGRGGRGSHARARPKEVASRAAADRRQRSS